MRWNIFSKRQNIFLYSSDVNKLQDISIYSRRKIGCLGKSKKNFSYIKTQLAPFGANGASTKSTLKWFAVLCNRAAPLLAIWLKQNLKLANFYTEANLNISPFINHRN